MKLPKTVRGTEDAMIELLFHFTVLVEYQLMDMQSELRTSVEKMNHSVMTLDQCIEDKIKKFPDNEDLMTLGKEARNHIFDLIQNLNIEDIQSQKTEHLLKSFKTLNEGIVAFLEKGLEHVPLADIRHFSDDIQKNIRQSYTMREERDIFDEVYQNK